MAAPNTNQDAYLQNARDIYTQIKRVGQARKKEGADQKALDDYSRGLVDQYNDLNKQFGSTTSLRDMYANFEQQAQKGYDTYSKTGKLPSDLRREAEAARAANAPNAPTAQPAAAAPAAESDAVARLGAPSPVSDIRELLGDAQAVKGLTDISESDRAQRLDGLRKQASDAYASATPEQRAANKDFFKSAASVLNPTAPAASTTGALAKAPSINSDLQRVRATEDVQMQRQYGSGLGTQAAVQSPDYELGSGSALRAAPRRLGSQSGDMRRAARRLRKQGYSRASEQMAMGAEMQRLGEGSAIKSEAQRGREAAQQMQQQDQLRQMQGLTQDLIGLRRGQIQRERERQGI